MSLLQQLIISKVGSRLATKLRVNTQAMSDGGGEDQTPSFEMTWGSTTSSGYCSQEDSDCEFEQYFTARTSFIRKPKKEKDEQIEWRKQELSISEIEQKVKEYNAQINSNLFMALNKDGSYTGFIKVQFKLDTAKHLHISSRTRAREVIEALLNKFTVVDNPRKFALFERSERHDQVYLRKLGDDERPLLLRLCAGPSEKALSLVLKENETGEVNWDAFTVPELHNFLRILQREEEEHVKQIVLRYARARDKMQQVLATSTPG
ncbi:hypothetical protein ANANG_G00224540 [Anguilla anguilla]|uniref:Ras association domain-containing protein 1 n=1 Tax=Anguilla anguilla TaxID=7936 RepID=A0A9D3LY55_ANGAN|nr:hypothetical protein ANANG_G00224540 [Anguilla anguilla]